MHLISFDPLRTLDIPTAKPIKPEHWLQEKEQLLQADWILFPEYWQVNALVYALKKRIFPNSNSYHLGHDKIEMTRAFQALCPANVPTTLILPGTETAEEEILDTFSFPFVAKEVRSSMGYGVRLLQNRSELRAYIRDNPVLYLQEHLPIDRDLRVVVIGKKVISAYWRIATQGNFHNNVAQGGDISFANLPVDALVFVEDIANRLGVNHAGFDVALVDGWFYLFEFNVRFGTQALHQQGISLSPYILQYLQEESLRL